MLPKPLPDSVPETQENAPAWWHKPTELDRLEYTVRRLEARILALEQAHEMSIEELQAEVLERYKAHTKNVVGIHVV